MPKRERIASILLILVVATLLLILGSWQYSLHKDLAKVERLCKLDLPGHCGIGMRCRKINDTKISGHCKTFLSPLFEIFER
jgi:hypothetical protein